MNAFKKIVRLTFLTLMVTLSWEALASVKSICGSKDDRVSSCDSRIAMFVPKDTQGTCTLTMIGKSCAISAGHCKGYFDYVEFDSLPSCKGPKKTYSINVASIEYQDHVIGGFAHDWAVFRLESDPITKKYPGEIQGFYKVGFDIVPNIGDMIRITGYGIDKDEPWKSKTQQTHSGPISSFMNITVGHQVDTAPANSGSALFHERSRSIIGVHTTGGCESRGSEPTSTGRIENSGSLIYNNEEFKKAIKECLDYERANIPSKFN